ncbi:unnamed protein product [Clonostachys solani]|uniref:FAD dependent oxidoreductase domain-containing protein n=1 Tax=Clonostachys solani TaxID=160281 RepID=A0A9P0EQ09_9HYPO|nr:unnamed protein product [Clonostachys solani]
MESCHPEEIIIIGAGVLGLSTALALLRRPKYATSTITLIDAAPELPNSSSASADTSRILRADYALKPYTRLVSQAQKLWKDVGDDGWGGQDRYHDASLVFTSQPGTQGHIDGYVEESLRNVKELTKSSEYGFSASQIRDLPNKEAIRRETKFPGVSGEFGYVNDNCGWVKADACVNFVYERIQQEGGKRTRIRPNSRVGRLLYDRDATRCCGVELFDGCQLSASLVILAAGAWTPSLVDLSGQAMATGQVLAYLPINEQEQRALKSSPIYFNVSRGMFMIPPHNRELKLGRHGFGYQNPTEVTFYAPDGKETRAMVSTPVTDMPIPGEAEAACREFLAELFPQWKNRKFSKTRLCWYCDTPSGDFLIDYHPHVKGLFLATGDSGHGFKVFPVIGDKIVDAIEGHLDTELKDLWRWKPHAHVPFDGTDDGTRGGRRGMMLEEEWKKEVSLDSRL